MTATTTEIRVMTSGAFTAAHLELIPQLELLTKRTIVTVTTSIGTGESSISNRLKRGEAADIVVVAESDLRQLIADGLVLAESYTPVARSTIGMAVRAGAPRPDIGSIDALRRTLVEAKSIAYSASVSGQYLTTELYQRLGIADQVAGKSRFIGGGERVGAVVARGEAEIGFQQISELLPVPGIAHITPLPPRASASHGNFRRRGCGHSRSGRVSLGHPISCGTRRGARHPEKRPGTGRRPMMCRAIAAEADRMQEQRVRRDA